MFQRGDPIGMSARSPASGAAIRTRLAVAAHKVEGRLQAMAIAGIEMARWDIKGKAAGVPLYQQLGSVYRGRVRMYATLKRDTPEAQARHARGAGAPRRALSRGALHRHQAPGLHPPGIRHAT